MTTVAYALGLTVLGALVAGVLPGLKITEGNPESRPRQSNTGLPGTGVSRLWSGIIIPMLTPVFIQVGLGISFAVGIIFLLGMVQSARGAALVATFAVFTNLGQLWGMQETSRRGAGSEARRRPAPSGRPPRFRNAGGH